MACSTWKQNSIPYMIIESLFMSSDEKSEKAESYLPSVQQFAFRLKHWRYSESDTSPWTYARAPIAPSPRMMNVEATFIRCSMRLPFSWISSAMEVWWANFPVTSSALLSSLAPLMKTFYGNPTTIDIFQYNLSSFEKLSEEAFKWKYRWLFALENTWKTVWYVNP